MKYDHYSIVPEVGLDEISSGQIARQFLIPVRKRFAYIFISLYRVTDNSKIFTLKITYILDKQEELQPPTLNLRRNENRKEE